MQLIDTHAHLYLEQYDQDRTQIIERAIDSGVNKILLPNVDENTINPMLNLCRSFPDNCIPMMAIHPTSVKQNYSEQISIVKDYLKDFNFCAIGETGIDLYWDNTYQKEQCDIFEKHIELACNYNLPLVIHSRNSLNEIFDILEKYKKQNLQGVFHCFPGNVEQAYEAVKFGFMIGVGGVVTYKNSKLADVVEKVDLKHLLLETDAPYLSPVPKRGKRNESSYLIHVAEKIAQIKNTDIDHVAKVTTKNAVNTFNL